MVVFLDKALIMGMGFYGIDGVLSSNTLSVETRENTLKELLET